MEIVAMEISTLLLLAAIILLLRRQRGAPPQAAADQATAAEDAARCTELAQQSCLSALEQLDINLAHLEQRTAKVERQLDHLTAVPDIARAEHYRAAALLLAAGHDAGRVANVLDLPLLHVEMIGELRKVLDGQAKFAGGSAPQRPAKAPRRKAVGGSVKAKLRPILLTDAVEAAQAANG